MPKKKKQTAQIASVDREIGSRLREVREFLGCSQKLVAEELGIKRERLASYESGRVAIRFEIAVKFCRQYVVSEDWLARGQTRFGPSESRLCMCLAVELICARIPMGATFSFAYEHHLRERYEALRQISPNDPRFVVGSGEEHSTIEHMVDYMLYKWLAALPKEQVAAFVCSLSLAGDLLVRDALAHPECNSIHRTPVETALLKLRHSDGKASQAAPAKK